MLCRHVYLFTLQLFSVSHCLLLFTSGSASPFPPPASPFPPHVNGVCLLSHFCPLLSCEMPLAAWLEESILLSECVSLNLSACLQTLLSVSTVVSLWTNWRCAAWSSHLEPLYWGLWSSELNDLLSIYCMFCLDGWLPGVLSCFWRNVSWLGSVCLRF